MVFYLLEAVFALVVPRFLPGTQGQKGVWRYALAFPNVGFIGYPVAVALFGDGALFYAAILALPFNLLSYSLGPLLLAGAARFRWKQLFTPCIVASVLGLVLALTRLRPPMVFTTRSIRPRKAKVIRVSAQFRYSSIPMVHRNVRELDSTLAKLLLIISDTVSMSLVKRLMRSPDWWVSK